MQERNDGEHARRVEDLEDMLELRDLDIRQDDRALIRRPLRGVRLAHIEHIAQEGRVFGEEVRVHAKERTFDLIIPISVKIAIHKDNS